MTLVFNSSKQTMFLLTLQSCLDDVTPWVAALVEGSEDGEHVHRLRIGLRKLRTLLKYHPKKAVIHGLGDCEPVLTKAFQELGRVRDAQIVIATVAPQLEKAGAPDVPWIMPRAEKSPAQVVKSVEFRRSLAHLKKACKGAGGKGATKSYRLSGKGKRVLRALYRKVRERGKGFTQLSPTDQHQLRKRLKSLRYLSEFGEPFLKKRKVFGKYLQRLVRLQGKLGRHNDLTVALSLIDKQAIQSGHHDAVVASQWLECQLKASSKRCERAFKRLVRKAF